VSFWRKPESTVVPAAPSPPERTLRLAVYCDYRYHVADGQVTAEMPFSLFLEGLAADCDRLVVLGRLNVESGPYPFPVTQAELAPLPHYDSGAEAGQVMRALPESALRFWRALDDVDAVWILGPNPPQALLFALIAMLRRRRVVLGVRQDLPTLIRHRRPHQRAVRCEAYVLEYAFRVLALRLPVVVVGSELARHYAWSKKVLSIYVSLLTETDLSAPAPSIRDYDSDELVMLSVGRLDPEKNPLMLVDALSAAMRSDPRWRLEICGDGPLADAVAARARELGVADHLVMHGYVPLGPRLWGLYRSSHALLHISMTEGVPQVILEAFASNLPVVATDVGGVAGLVGGRGLLIAPSDPAAAADALNRFASSAELRNDCVEAARNEVRNHTLDQECARLAQFLGAESGASASGAWATGAQDSVNGLTAGAG
jgi:glycosyltransferase involved in cell wall biosynthesis